jgi:signal transduction histidine kinase
LAQLSHGGLLQAACWMRYPVFLIIAALLVVFIRFFTEIPLFPRFVFTAAALLWGEYWVINATAYRPDDELKFWIASRAVLLLFALVILAGLELLKSGLRRIADGDVEYRMKTKLRLGYFRETGDLVNRIYESTAKAVDDRMKSERLKTELIANVSHDIKTPLTSIINYVDLIGREQTDNEKIAEYTQVLARHSSRLKRLIEDLIEASKASSGSIDLVPEPIDLKILLSQVLGDYEGVLAESDLTLIVTQHDENVIITADGRYMARIIDNLMSNIKKYALEGTRVYVDMTDTEGKVRLSFKNVSKFRLNISAEELMERFTRGDRSRHTEGSGLGLNIAKSLTELMGGTIELFVDGDYFRVTLEFEK